MFDYQFGDLLLAPFLYNVGGEKLFWGRLTAALDPKRSFAAILAQCPLSDVKWISIRGIEGKKKAGPTNGTGRFSW